MATWRTWIAANVRTKRKLFAGLTDPELPDYIAQGRDFVYIDHGYWNRGHSFRTIVGATHLAHLLDRPGDRISTNPVGGVSTTPRAAPWQKRHDNGGQIVIIPPSEVVSGVFRIEGGPRGWMDRMGETLRKYTDRDLRFKKEKSPPLREYCYGCHAVVTFGSVAGVEAALMGYPVFSGPICPTTPISAGPLENIESPVYSDNREAWLRSLSYAQYTCEELAKMKLEGYEYSRRNDRS